MNINQKVNLYTSGVFVYYYVSCTYLYNTVLQLWYSTMFNVNNITLR